MDVLRVREGALAEDLQVAGQLHLRSLGLIEQMIRGKIGAVREGNGPEGAVREAAAVIGRGASREGALSGLREGGGADKGHALRKLHVLQRRAVPEGVLVDEIQRVGQDHLFQGGAALEGAALDLRHALGDHDLLKGLIVFKSVAADKDRIVLADHRRDLKLGVRAAVGADGAAGGQDPVHLGGAGLVPRGGIQLHGIHEGHELLVVQELFIVLRLPAVAADMGAGAHLVVEFAEHIHAVDNRRLFSLTLFKGVLRDDADPFIVPVSAGELLALVRVDVMLQIRVVLGGDGDAAAQLTALEKRDHAVFTRLHRPARGEGGGNAVGRVLLAVGCLHQLEAVQHRAELTVVQVVVDVRVVLRLQGLQADLHAEPLAHQRLAVIQNDVHGGSIVLVGGVQPSLADVVGPDPGREACQGRGNVPGPVFLDPVSGVIRGSVHVVDHISEREIRRTEHELPPVLLIRHRDMAVVLSPSLIHCRDALGQPEDQVLLLEFLLRQPVLFVDPRDGVLFVQFILRRLLLHERGLRGGRGRRGCRGSRGGLRRLLLAAAGEAQNDRCRQNDRKHFSFHGNSSSLLRLTDCGSVFRRCSGPGSGSLTVNHSIPHLYFTDFRALLTYHN